MESWSILLQKEAFKFSAAHFLIFPDGSAERLHGHNYRVFLELQGSLSPQGLVIDFKAVKPVIKALVDELDEHWLVPGEHPELQARRCGDGNTEVLYRERRYLSPDEDVIIMSMNNISAENLATWVGRELRRRLAERFPELHIAKLRLAVEETSNQRGVYHFDAS